MSSECKQGTDTEMVLGELLSIEWVVTLQAWWNDVPDCRTRNSDVVKCVSIRVGLPVVESWLFYLLVV